MIVREVLLGLLIGIAFNVMGMFLYSQLILEQDLGVVFKEAYQGGFLGIIIGLGAILNFLPFFVFMRKKKNYRARGIILSIIVAAITIIILQIDAIF